MTALVGDEVVVDEEFWKMDMFNDEEGDEEYKSEAGLQQCCFLLSIHCFLC